MCKEQQFHQPKSQQQDQPLAQFLQLGTLQESNGDTAHKQQSSVLHMEQFSLHLLHFLCNKKSR
jgi:hypothetical protein